MASTQRQPHHSLVFLFIMLFLHIAISYTASSISEDTAALLKLKEALKDEKGALKSWDPSTSPCYQNKNNWVGVTCSRAGNIWGLRLENMSLSGFIDFDSLIGLSKLRSVSFMHNSFSGHMPNFRKLKLLKGIFLSYNNYEGTIPSDAFQELRRLRKVHLSFNNFSGDIPISLETLDKLVELNLEFNKFQGPIPNLKGSQSLKVFNVSNNELQGPVPADLAKFDAGVFSGNKNLCGPPLNACPPEAPAEVPKTEPVQSPLEQVKKAMEKPIPIATMVIGMIMAVVLALILIVLILRSSHEKNIGKSSKPTSTTNFPRKTMMDNGEDDDGQGSPISTTAVVGGGGGGFSNKSGEHVGRLTFVREDKEKFDLPDLLRASAEVLGSGSFGSSYKAILNNGSAVVVKRFKQMNNVGRVEFQEHMRRLGRLSHPNLLPLVAYYYRKEEKLFITVPIDKGSLAILLHGKSRGNISLDWPTRLKVVKGVARGLSYLYKELACLVAPHGHLKSSNVLLDNSFEPLLGDYALIPLINQESVQEMMVAYKSPEYQSNGRITKKTDVWSLGILIIEVLTGKFPAACLQHGSDVDMAIWVRSVINEGFDKSMGQARNFSLGEMQKLLDIAMACCERNVDKRLDIKEACERIDEVRERDYDDDFYSTCASTDARSSRGASEDFTAVIN